MFIFDIEYIETLTFSVRALQGAKILKWGI